MYSVLYWNVSKKYTPFPLTNLDCKDVVPQGSVCNRRPGITGPSLVANSCPSVENRRNQEEGYTFVLYKKCLFQELYKILLTNTVDNVIAFVLWSFISRFRVPLNRLFLMALRMERLRKQISDISWSCWPCLSYVFIPFVKVFFSILLNMKERTKPFMWCAG